MDRRLFLSSLVAAAALPMVGGDALAASGAALDPFFNDLQERTFRFFWSTTNPANGLTPDRWPSAPFCSIAAVGFALTAYPIGVERGWVSRAAARERVLATLRFFDQAPQGSAARGMTGNKGLFYHFLDLSRGARFEEVELSTIDTALLMAGVLFCQSYFEGDHPAEAQIRRLAEALYRRVDWRWASPQTSSPGITMGWTPEEGFNALNWRGYNEAAILHLLALGSPTFPADPGVWLAWQENFDRSWGLNGGPLPHVGYHTLFVHQYSHVWVDFRGVRDAYMRRRGLDYFENSRRATLAQRAWAIANPYGWKGYGKDIWGLTACDGPGPVRHDYRGRSRLFEGYNGGRGPGPTDDGTLAPTAALGSIAFAPEVCSAAALAMRDKYGAQILGRFGFIDAFNPSFDFDDAPPKTGRRIPGMGWIGPDYLGIDQGPIVAMIENWRSGLIWKTMRRNPHIVRGLRRAGFTGGWLEGA